MELDESRMRKKEKEDERMEHLRQTRERDTMDLQRTRREDVEKAQRLHDKVKSGHEAHRQKKKLQIASYRKDARQSGE